MGAVYAVEHVNTGGLWALKVMLDCTRLQAERATRFRREARASARITSDHVVKVTDADTAAELDGAPFLVMELLEGQDVERLLQKHGKLQPREALHILTQVARGLDKAHAAGVIHRDLKPENVFLHRREDGSEIVKVLDFGISKVLRPDGDLASASVTGASDLMGTPLYMAPEQVSPRQDQVGPATDVWAVGLMAVRMLTGEVYWTGETIPEVFVQILSDHRPTPSARWPGLGPAFDAWFLRCVALRAGHRFQSVGEQIAELSAILTGERASSPSATPPPHRPLHHGVPMQATQPLVLQQEKSSSRPVMGLSVSTAGPLSQSVLPTGPPRGIFIAVGLVVLVVAGFLALPLLRPREGTVITRDSGASALPVDPVASGNLVPSAAGAGARADLTSTTTSETRLIPSASASPIASADAGTTVRSVAAARPPVRPVLIGVAVSYAATAAATAAGPSAAPSAAPSAKPPTRPADLFDTQK